MADRESFFQQVLIRRLSEDVYFPTDSEDRDEHVLRADGLFFMMLKAHDSMTYELGYILDRSIDQQQEWPQGQALANTVLAFEGCVGKTFVYNHRERWQAAFALQPMEWSHNLVREALWLGGGLKTSRSEVEAQATLYRQQHDWASLADLGAHQDALVLVWEAQGHLGVKLNPDYRPLLLAFERHQALQDRPPTVPRPARRRT